MITDYMNQTGTWESRTDVTDDYGNPTYNDPVTIRGRFRQKLTNLLTGTSSVTVGQWICVTDSAVEAGDKVNGRIVLAVSTYVNADGVTIGRKVIT